MKRKILFTCCLSTCLLVSNNFVEAKMSSLEKEIDEDLMSKYKTLKSDKIFPVFVGFNDGHCSGCRVEIPTSKVNKLKTDGTIVCEQCHRIIYNK